MESNELHIGADGVDTLFQQAVDFVNEVAAVSISGVQRKLRIGYNRAVRIVEQMEGKGYVSAPDSDGRRSVLATADSATA